MGIFGEPPSSLTQFHTESISDDPLFPQVEKRREEEISVYTRFLQLLPSVLTCLSLGRVRQEKGQSVGSAKYFSLIIL